MISSVLNVQDNFYRLFQGIEICGSAVNCRYARKSSGDYTEEQEQQIYPCIAIQDYQPTPDRRHYIDLKKYHGARNLAGTLIELVRQPMWMNFKFDVSIASKSYTEYQMLSDYFLQHFVSEQQFIFNKVDLSELYEGEVGDVVPYEINITDIPRYDGVFETNYEFTLFVWIQITKVEEVAVVKQINVNTEIVDLDVADGSRPFLDWVLKTGNWNDDGQ